MASAEPNPIPELATVDLLPAITSPIGFLIHFDLRVESAVNSSRSAHSPHFAPSITSQ